MIGIKIPMQLAGTSLGFNLVGGAFNSSGLQSAAATTNKFIAPAVDISMGGCLIKQIRELKKK